uniref:SLAM family member 5-like n=1 Tax=Scleropages formosus TaxID=113540 RepID=A0A8C9VG72_SCLFO
MGESFTFPAPVLTRGFLLHGELGAVAVIIEGIDYILLTDTFKDRLQWDKQTGLFTITELKLQDDGEYKVDNSDGQRIQITFQLTVYSRFSFSLSFLLDTQNCSVLCSVENDRDVTLGKEILNQTSSPHLNITPSLPLDIEVQDSDTHSCVSSNPVSEESAELDTQKFLNTSEPPLFSHEMFSDVVLLGIERRTLARGLSS